MGLMPLHHARTLASPAEAEAFMRALGETVVSARGYHTTSPVQIGRLLDAVDPHPKRDNTVSFEGGALDRATLESFTTTGAYQYFDVRTRDENLRVWPDRSDLSAELAAFRAPLATPIDRGFVMKLGARGIEPYRQFLLAIRGRVDVVLEIGVAVARGLAEAFTTEPHDWQAGGALVHFPSGTIHGFARMHSLEKERKKWFKRIDKAVAKL